MSLVSKASTAGPDGSTGQFAPQITGLIAGEDLGAVDACYIKAADGKVWRSNGTAATEPASFSGFTARSHKTGEPVTLFQSGARFSYGSGLTPRAKYYVAATAGGLDTAATTGGTVAVAEAINATDIRVIAMTA